MISPLNCSNKYPYKTSNHSSPSKSNLLLNISNIPVEPLAFAVAGFITFSFKFNVAYGLGGISLGLLTTSLAAKTISLYNSRIIITMTKEICKLVKHYPRLQFISFVCTLIICTISRNLGFCAGIIVGGFNATILDVEKYKRIRRAR